MKNEEGGIGCGRAYRRTLEMTIGRAEFLRLLPAAVGVFEVVPLPSGALRITPARATPPRAEPAMPPVHASWSIDFVPLEPLEVGSVRVPRHRVELDLPDGPADAREALMERFDRAFLRGGG